MTELVLSLLLLGGLCAVASGYALRVRSLGVPSFERVDREGRSPLLGKGTMRMGYWAMEPIGRACARAGITANMITWATLVFGALSGVAVALGRFGVGGALVTAASLCDVLDGQVARQGGSASRAGSLLDASVDRYAEFFFLAGLAVHYRAELAPLLLTLAALAGLFMVSYASAKAEALQVEAPRGSMRRVERAVCLATGSTLTPLSMALWPGAPALLAEAPMVAALAVVAVASNASAVLRLARVAESTRGKPE